MQNSEPRGERERETEVENVNAIRQRGRDAQRHQMIVRNNGAWFDKEQERERGWDEEERQKEKRDKKRKNVVRNTTDFQMENWRANQ